MRHSHVVELRSAILPDLSEAAITTFSDAILADRRLAGPAPSANVALSVLEIRTNVDAETATDALGIAVGSFERAAKRARLDVQVLDASVWLDDHPSGDRHELLSGAEVAERLGMTRQRVQQLASEKGRFPTPVATFGTVSVWHWGDIADWVAAGGRGDANRMTALAAAFGVQLSGTRNPDHRDALVQRLVDLANNGDEDAIEFVKTNPALAFHDREWIRQIDSGRGPGFAAGARGSIVQTRRT